MLRSRTHTCAQSSGAFSLAFLASVGALAVKNLPLLAAKCFGQLLAGGAAQVDQACADLEALVGLELAADTADLQY